MGKSNEQTEIIFTPDLWGDLQPFISAYQKGKVFLVTETRVYNLWLRGSLHLEGIPVFVLPAGEENKNLESVMSVWQFLSEGKADRKSLLINIGGGMLTDLAGFAASTFKRGIDFINVPTTLLSQVDASVGGKTGFNFNGLKNEIGTFREPRAVVMFSPFLQTLDRSNFLSGFAEMVKHGLIRSPEHLSELMDFSIDPVDYGRIQELIRQSVEVKKYFVDNDPLEKNIRKALNFGHTIGHAIESLFLEQKRPVLHGYAVAWGMVAELCLSSVICGLPEQDAHRISGWITGIYGKSGLRKEDHDSLVKLMFHDKKNENDEINFTLLSAIGRFRINQNCSDELIFKSLDILS